MGSTITEKILANACGKDSVKPFDFEWVKADVLMTHDPCSPGVFGEFKKQFGENAKVWNNEKHIMIPDHFIYTTDAAANRNLDIMRAFAKEQGIKYFYDFGTENYNGVCHTTLAEFGHFRPGEVLFGTDSHTVTGGAFGAFAAGIGNTDAAFVLGTGKLFVKIPPSKKFVFEGKKPDYITGKDIILAVLGNIGTDGATYAAMEFEGRAIENLGIGDRMTVCNMAIEAGAKNGIMKPNRETIEYVKKRTSAPFHIFESDSDAGYESEGHYDVSSLEPLVAKPHSPANVAKVSEVEGEKLAQAFIGSCTGGKTDDLVMAAKVLSGRKVSIPTFIVPATRNVIREIVEEKIGGKTVFEILLESGAKLSTEPSCSACCGGPRDTFGRMNSPGKCISATNRNFLGRMGDKGAEIYLASPLTVAASAVEGKIADPRKFLE